VFSLVPRKAVGIQSHLSLTYQLKNGNKPQKVAKLGNGFLEEMTLRGHCQVLTTVDTHEPW
jgi:hypothetical protein